MSRRQRRANAAASQTASAIPLSTPDYRAHTNIQTKTLYEIAAERQVRLEPRAAAFPKSPRTAEEVKYVKITPDGTVQETTAAGGIKPAEEKAGYVSPFLDTLFLASSLSALHFTLDVLTVHQYAQELRFPPILINTLFVAFPTLTFAIHLLNGHLFPQAFHSFPRHVLNGFKMLQQLIFLLTANVAGCYLIYVTNDKGYYAVMKQAPSIGTIWVWCIIELGLAGALTGVVGPALYAWYNGYGIF